jgi:uncharacterized DUF497 family protein
MALGFSWDPAKADANARKHGVTFEEAVTAFGDPYSLAIPDPDHSRTEDRFILIGRSSRERLLTVVHPERGDTIRIISARRASRREHHAYEEAI